MPWLETVSRTFQIINISPFGYFQHAVLTVLRNNFYYSTTKGQVFFYSTTEGNTPLLDYIHQTALVTAYFTNFTDFFFSLLCSFCPFLTVVTLTEHYRVPWTSVQSRSYASCHLRRSNPSGLSGT